MRASQRSVIELFIMMALLAAFSQAQNGDDFPCGQSTVSDNYGPEFASRAESFLRELQHAVRKNDRTKLATMVHYPINVSWGTRVSRISTRSEFIRKYRSIMTSDLKQTILNQKPECLFANGGGVMVGHGQLWFQEQKRGVMKIIRITLD